jgi:drug/metabolite transporter (DMT)-like permease
MDLRTAVAAAVCLLFWSSAFAGIRAALTAYPPVHVALLRFLIAAALLAGAAAVRGGLRRPDKKIWPHIVATGFCGVFLYQLALNTGELTVPAGPASFIVNTAPIFTVLLARFVLKEHLPPLGWAGVLVSFLGVGLIAAGEGGGLHPGKGVFLILLAAVSHSLYFIVQKPALKEFPAFDFSCYTLWSGTAFLLIFSPGLPETVRSAPLAATGAVAYLGLVAAVSGALWSYVLQRMEVSRAAALLYAVPALAIATAWVWMREVPSLLSLVGGTIALAGVVIVNRSRPKKTS